MTDLLHFPPQPSAIVNTAALEPATMENPVSAPTVAKADTSAIARQVQAPSWRSLRPPLWSVIAASGMIVAAAYFYVPAYYVIETDDAYVEADTVTVVPKVAGFVTALHLDDNSTLTKGTLVAELDPRDYKVALDSAAANLLIAQAAKVNVEQQIIEQERVIAAAQAAVDGAVATLAFAKQQFDRYQELQKSSAGSVEKLQQVQSDVAVNKATLDHDNANLAAAQMHIGVLQSELAKADAAIGLAQASVDKARLDLSYTKLFISLNGTVANKSVQVGNYVQPGQTLFSAVPGEMYIVANFKETQLSLMRVGQAVSIRVDAFPDLRLYGHVDSFQRGTGSSFALLPPENATGNFLKVVQRVPVKIVIDGSNTQFGSLAPGMSVEPSVVINQPPAWLAWLI